MSNSKWIKYEPSALSDYIPMSEWGKDHWSTLAYLETRAVDHSGLIDNRHMRCNPRLHRIFAHSGSFSGKEYPTRLKRSELENHDDWSCVEDMVSAGLIEAWFSESRGKIKFTDYGQSVANLLRVHKMNGGSFSTFEEDETNLVSFREPTQKEREYGESLVDLAEKHLK